MDLFGEHSVQAVASTLEAALVLTLAALLVLLSVRVAQQSVLRPTLAPVPRRARIAPPGRDTDAPSVRWLCNSLPTRAPPPCDPGPLPVDRRGRRQRFRPTPPSGACEGSARLNV